MVVVVSGDGGDGAGDGGDDGAGSRAALAIRISVMSRSENEAGIGDGSGPGSFSSAPLNAAMMAGQSASGIGRYASREMRATRSGTMRVVTTASATWSCSQSGLLACGELFSLSRMRNLSSGTATVASAC